VTKLSANDRYLRKADGSNRQFRARLHAGYSFATSLRFKPVYACLRRFKNRSGGRFVHFREPARKLLNTNELVQHLESRFLTWGQRFKSPLRDASQIKDLCAEALTLPGPLYCTGYALG
jgi:hypothetical protein